MIYTKPRWYWGKARKLEHASLVHAATRRRGTFRYDGASAGARLRGWHSTGNSGNSEVAGGLQKLQQRSRELMQNEWRAKAAIRAVVRGIAGSSIRPLPTVSDQEHSRAIKRAWKIHNTEARASSDSTWDTTVDQAVQAMATDGECFITAHVRDRLDGLLVPVQWQLLESDMLDVNYSEDLGKQGRIVQGIEFDAKGRRAFYHFWSNHPGDSVGFSASGQERVKVKAGEVIHLWNQAEARPGQVRGVPWTHAVMVAIRDVGVTEDALRVALQGSAMTTGFITSPNQDALANFMPNDDNPDAKGTEMLEATPGLFGRLDPGEEVEFTEIKAPAGVTDYLNSGDHGIAQGIGTTYEDMTGDLKQVNYSSARMGRSNTRAWYRMIRDNVVIPQMCMVAWRWFVSVGKLAGEIPMGYDYRDVRWVASAEEGIDPVKDAKAMHARLAAGVSNLEDEIEGGFGGDYYGTIDGAERVKKDLEKRGLKYDWVVDLSGPAELPQ